MLPLLLLDVRTGPAPRKTNMSGFIWTQVRDCFDLHCSVFQSKWQQIPKRFSLFGLGSVLLSHLSALRKKPLPVKHFLLYHLNLFLLLWLSQGPLCCFTQHTPSPASWCTVTCHGAFLPLFSSRSMLSYVNFFHLYFSLPGSLIFANAPLQGTWGLMCLLMVLLWAAVKFIIFFKIKT